MRWIVISLLVVNTLLLGWRWFAASERSAPASAPAATAAPAIELLPEGAVSPERSAAATLADSEVAVAASVQTPAPEGPASIASESALTSDSATVSTVTEPAAPGADPAVADALVTESARANPLDAASSHSSSPLPNTMAAPVEAATQCAWTPWRERPVSDLGTAELVQTEQQEAEIGRSYLVFVPAKASRELTLQRLAELKAQGIEAAYLNKGPQAGGISLGLFSKPESMQLRLDELKKSGVTDVNGIERIRTEPRIRQLLRWTGEKTPSSVQNQALVSCNDIAPTAAGQ